MTRTALPDEWIRSTYSQSNGGECIEWAPSYARVTGQVLVRDSKNPGGSHLTLTPEAFTGLVTLARSADV